MECNLLGDRPEAVWSACPYQELQAVIELQAMNSLLYPGCCFDEQLNPLHVNISYMQKEFDDVVQLTTLLIKLERFFFFYCFLPA